MSKGIKLTNREMKHIALFENITGATVRDCIIDSDYDRIIFLVKEGEMGMAIGRGGKNVFMLERMTGQKHEIIEFSDDPVRFLKNSLKPSKVKEIRITEKPDGKTMAVISVDPRDKGIAIGKNGKNVEKIRFLARRYFQINNVSIL
jgi:N utilization substance protein A